MRNTVLKYSAWLSLGVGAAMGSVAAIHLAARLPPPGVDIKWEAIGSVGAIFAALWIADRERRQRRKDEKVVAVASAAEMLHDAETILHRITRVIDRYDVAQATPIFDITLLHYGKEMLKDFSPWPAEKIISLSALPNDCAMNLARAQHAISSTKTRLSDLLGDGSRTPDKDLAYTCWINAHDSLKRAKWNLEEAVGDMITAAAPAKLAALD